MLNFSHVAAPVNKILKKEQGFDLPPLGKDQSTAFTAHMKSVTTPPVLVLQKLGIPYSLDTDATCSDRQVGAALSQSSPDRERYPIGYWSRSLNPAEKNYSEWECLAVVWALTILGPYGEDFIVHSDHVSLRWLINIAEPSGRLMRWRFRLSEFNFEAHQKKGYLNTEADALSRLGTDGETSVEVDENIPCFLAENNTEPDRVEDQYQREMDAILATSPAPDGELFSAITTTVFIREQHANPFCSEIRSRLNGGSCYRFR